MQDPVRRKFLASAIKEKAAIEIMSYPKPGFYSRIFLVPKSENKWRPIIYISALNAYFHVPIHPESRRYLRFLHQGVVWQFKALPFGLNTAPQAFTKVKAPKPLYHGYVY
jgi:hypothetical protein